MAAILPITPPSLLSHSLLGILTGTRWASRRRGETAVDPPSVCPRRDYIISSLPEAGFRLLESLGLTQSQFWGMGGKGHERKQNPEGANLSGVTFGWALWNLEYSALLCVCLLTLRTISYT